VIAITCAVEPALGGRGRTQVGLGRGEIIALVVCQAVEFVVQLAVGRLRDGQVPRGQRPEPARSAAGGRRLAAAAARGQQDGARRSSRDQAGHGGSDLIRHTAS